MKEISILCHLRNSIAPLDIHTYMYACVYIYIHTHEGNQHPLPFARFDPRPRGEGPHDTWLPKISPPHKCINARSCLLFLIFMCIYVISV